MEGETFKFSFFKSLLNKNILYCAKCISVFRVLACSYFVPETTMSVGFVRI